VVPKELEEDQRRLAGFRVGASLRQYPAMVVRPHGLGLEQDGKDPRRVALGERRTGLGCGRQEVVDAPGAGEIDGTVAVEKGADGATAVQTFGKQVGFSQSLIGFESGE